MLAELTGEGNTRGGGGNSTRVQIDPVLPFSKWSLTVGSSLSSIVGYNQILMQKRIQRWPSYCRRCAPWPSNCRRCAPPWPSNRRLRDLSKLPAGLEVRLPTPVLPSGGQKLPQSGRRGEQGERRLGGNKGGGKGGTLGGKGG